MPDGKYVENLEARRAAIEYAFRRYEYTERDELPATEDVLLSATEFYEFLTSSS